MAFYYEIHMRTMGFYMHHVKGMTRYFLGVWNWLAVACDPSYNKCTMFFIKMGRLISRASKKLHGSNCTQHSIKLAEAILGVLLHPDRSTRSRLGGRGMNA